MANSEIKCLEHPTLKVPYEMLNKKFRAAQKNIDREVQRVQAAASELEKCLLRSGGGAGGGGGPTVAEVTLALDGVSDKLSLMKRKAEESLQDEVEVAKASKRRIDHLKEGEGGNAGVGGGGEGGAVTPALQAWRRKRLDRMLVEYFLRTGYYSAALRLARHSGIEDLTNIDLFLSAREIELALEHRDTSKCLAWCHENKSRLRKMKSTLEFSLRQQEFVELVRAESRLEAVKHARRYFGAGAEDVPCIDIQHCMGLLAFPIDTKVSPYQEMLDPSSWKALIHQFRAENFKLFQLSHDSVFSVTLQTGLSALKTPQCYQQDCSSSSSRTAACPVCSKHFNALARKLPFAHCAQSRLICSVSGQPLNEHNPPMVLPNGHVYGQNALVAMAAINDGNVVCPRTKSVFPFHEAEKVFVM